MSNDIERPEEIRLESITIDGQDVLGIFMKLEIFENIYTPIITGQIQLMETDNSGFIEKFGIEGNEPISVSVKCHSDQCLKFEGVLNGLRNKSNNQQMTVYTFDFTTEQMRKNEETRITKSFKEVKPEEIIEEMVTEMGGEMDRSVSQGLNMNYIVPRQRPWDVIKYVITHGVATTSSVKDADNEDVIQQDQESEGTTGFLLWQSLADTKPAYRFCSIDDLLAGKGGDNRGEYVTQLANQGTSLEEQIKSILKYDFPIAGDMQAKMRSGGFRSVNIIFDIDKGLYREYTYDGTPLMTDKQQGAVTKPTRYTLKLFSNERHNQECSKASPHTGDQSKLNTSQTHARENTFDDSQGTFTLYPQFTFRAGDTFTAKIAKVKSEGDGGYDKKYSGNYVIKEVSHSFRVDGKGYTKIGVIRSTKQQNDASS